MNLKKILPLRTAAVAAATLATLSTSTASAAHRSAVVDVVATTVTIHLDTPYNGGYVSSVGAVYTTDICPTGERPVGAEAQSPGTNIPNYQNGAGNFTPGYPSDAPASASHWHFDSSGQPDGYNVAYNPSDLQSSVPEDAPFTYYIECA